MFISLVMGMILSKKQTVIKMLTTTTPATPKEEPHECQRIKTREDTLSHPPEELRAQLPSTVQPDALSAFHHFANAVGTQQHDTVNAKS
jgi:hypothetical protein